MNYKRNKSTLYFLLGVLILSSCSGQSPKTDSIIEDSIPVSDNSNEKYSQALQDYFEDITTSNETAKKEFEKAKEKRRKEAIAERETAQAEKSQAPYGYNQWGEPYASQDHKNLDKALDEFEKARQGYITATYGGNPMDLMYYHQRMKQKIEDCLFYARSIGDRGIINKLKEYERMVDNLEY